MENLYEYLIGGKKIGQKKEAPTFGDLREGDVFYVYNFDKKLNMTLSYEWKVEKVVKRSGGRIVFDSTRRGGNGRSSWKMDDVISIWKTSEGGANYCAATTEQWDQKDLINEINARYKTK